ncbi:predicted protein [Plenodomus lingam JN3]|uniref:Uncharacterized protein n=1 Tax=Leptosphaeria maculans (strain JN3 / isolate v23.1.3 / race Av1-4-5-6-7-8) TaxID=985895 RepID=E5A653_LEPMJ|nr:predicted protein [Plenodomus lingam JN3]CBX99098.1 predicted protein [Plenodomus lingam JN3]
MGWDGLSISQHFTRNQPAPPSPSPCCPCCPSALCSLPLSPVGQQPWVPGSGRGLGDDVRGSFLLQANCTAHVKRTTSHVSILLPHHAVHSSPLPLLFLQSRHESHDRHDRHDRHDSVREWKGSKGKGAGLLSISRSLFIAALAWRLSVEKVWTFRGWRLGSVVV